MNPVIVGIAEFKFAVPPQRLVTYGLGSCVAIVLHSQEADVGCLAHIMLPYAYSVQENATPGKFADSAVTVMASQMGERGVEPSRITAKIAGGADMFAGQHRETGRRVGARNVLAVKKALEVSGIHLVAQDVGGTSGRTVEYTVETGRFLVRTLREGVKEL